MKIGIIGSGNTGATLVLATSSCLRCHGGMDSSFLRQNFLTARSSLMPRMRTSQGGLGVYDLGDSTSSEEIAKLMRGARLIKAFNTMYYKTLASEGKKSKGSLAIFVAGDDEQGKQVVAKLIEDIGFAPVDTGSLREGGRRQQPDSSIYNKPMTVDEARKILAR